MAVSGLSCTHGIFAGAPGLHWPLVCGILVPRPRIKPKFETPALEGDSQALDHQARSWSVSLKQDHSAVLWNWGSLEGEFRGQACHLTMSGHPNVRSLDLAPWTGNRFIYCSASGCVALQPVLEVVSSWEGWAPRRYKGDPHLGMAFKTIPVPCSPVSIYGSIRTVRSRRGPKRTIFIRQWPTSIQLLWIPSKVLFKD